MDLIGAKHPFYRVAWRRYATVAAAVVWALFEWIVASSPFWGMIATGVSALAGYELIYNYKPADTDGENNAKS